MFNNFNLTDNEIMKIVNDYEPLIRKKSEINNKFNEDLYQEIRIYIFKILSKNRKRKWKLIWENKKIFEKSTI